MSYRLWDGLKDHISILMFRAVHRSGRVGFVPNPDSTRLHRVVTRNRLGQSFKSVSSGRIGFGSILVDFRFVGVEQNPAGFSLKYGQISSDLTRSDRYFPISIKIGPRSWWIWPKYAYIVGLKSLESVDLLVFVWNSWFPRREEQLIGWVGFVSFSNS